jgi:conjugal transfer/entry exclusion protein
MPNSALKVVSIPTRPPTPRYLNSSALPASGQQQLSAVMSRFDRLMDERPRIAMEVLRLADQIMKIYGA